MVSRRASTTQWRNSDAPASSERFAMIVIGGGTIGLSAAYYSAARGLKTLLLEQFDITNDWAGSGGASRFFRVMHSEPFMIRLAETALGLWREIETGSGIDILQTHPLIFYGDPKSTIEGNLAEMDRVLSALGIPHDYYPDMADLMTKYPVFKKNNMPSGYMGLVQPTSAAIRVKSSISAFKKLLAGKPLSDKTTLLANQWATVKTPEGPYQVECEAGTYSTDSLILCPGPWTNSVLEPFGIQLDLKIWQMTIGYFQAEVDKYDYPLWYEFGPEENQLYYGFPADEEVPDSIKVSVDDTKHKYTTPGGCNYQPDSGVLKNISEFLQRRFHGVKKTWSNPSTCLYTVSPDEQVTIDRLGFHNIAIYTGDSGRGFKFTPLFGRILVDLATTGKTPYDISPFSVTRPGIISSFTSRDPRLFLGLFGPRN
jgi:monomeric sarcosine oxidase